MPTPDANLQLVMFLSYLMNVALSALLIGSGRPFPGAWLWVMAQGLLALGTLFDALPPILPAWLPLVVGNCCYTASSVLFFHSVWAFRYRDHPARAKLLYWIVLAQLVSFVLVLNQPYWIRSMVFSSWMAVGSLAIGALLVWRVDRHFRFSHWLTALPFLALAVASSARVVILVEMDLRNELAQVGVLNVWYVSSAVLLGTIILFGYFMMTRVRAEQDLTSRDEAIEARNRKLIETSRAKDLFFSVIAHDLRGPIGGAARYVRKHLLGKMTGLENKYTEVETLASALEKTNEFLEKLLWWSRAQLQDWAPARGPIDLAKILEQVLSLVRAAADVKEISIEVTPGPYPQAVADPESVGLILGNLLSNAVKFSLPGHRIRLLVTEESGLCRLTVEDQGVGMDEATLDRLFRIEDKLSTHGTTGERGSGMGLLLAKSLAERNQGGITIDSTPGVGTRATLWLPSLTLGSPN